MFNEFNTFDIALGLYHWLQHNWTSQSDPLYEAFCVLTSEGMFIPSHSGEYFENLDGEAKIVYDMLTIQNYEQAMSYKSEEDLCIL